MISGVLSIHDNKKEDRRFRLLICKLSPKCTELESIVYDYDSTIVDQSEQICGKTTKDNLNHPVSGSFTTEIWKTSQESLADSYSFSKTSGYEVGGR